MTRFKKLLVPLDGSHLAEAVLPAVHLLAERFGATVSLLHVMERGAPEKVHGEHHLANIQEAEAYLSRVARACDCQGRVELHVHPNEERDVVASIIGHAREFEADLIILATHGWGGMRDLLVGSIAQQVLRRGGLPVLLIKPTPSGGAPPFDEGKRLLVPLDGKQAHDGVVLPVVEGVAKALDSHLDLLLAVPTLATMPSNQAPVSILSPTATSVALDMEEEEGREYLSRVAQELKGRKIPVSAEVRRGDPVTCVVEAAQKSNPDLIVMATHGRAGLDAFWSASVGSKILARIHQPLLLVRVAE